MYLQRWKRLWNDVARATLCRLGVHAAPTGAGVDACLRGCGLVRRPLAAQPYVVTLKDGSMHHVRAINPYHAASVVIYGGDMRLDANGKPRGEPKVHRANVASVRLETD